ncbi:MAG: hypothetical protein IJ766_02200 [Clostridia bacterium]|nr:hypothetical protein [Clostridia bacterium]
MNKKIAVAVILCLACVSLLFGACNDNRGNVNTPATSAQNTANNAARENNNSILPGTNIPDTTVDGALENAADRIMDGAENAADRVADGVNDVGNGLESRVDDALDMGRDNNANNTTVTTTNNRND